MRSYDEYIISVYRICQPRPSSQAKDVILVFGRVQVTAQLIRRSEELGLDAECLPIGRGFFGVGHM